VTKFEQCATTHLTEATSIRARSESYGVDTVTEVQGGIDRKWGR
jgi:hypothetical protein